LTCILFALDREVMFFRGALTSRQTVRGGPCPAWHARVENERVLVLITGMGAAAAERALSWVLRNGRIPDRVVSAGFCGGLADAARIGALIQPAEVVDPEGRSWQLSLVRPAVPRLCQPCEATPLPDISHARLTQPWHGVLSGRLVSAASPVLGREARQALQRRTRAVVVDMETATLARLCEEAGVPFACLRAVSDDGNTLLSPALSDALSGERVCVFGLLRAVLRRPWLVVELMRLARQSRIAAAALAQGLPRLLERRIKSP
jgi:adenosylhomocysteine nucleosidase